MYQIFRNVISNQPYSLTSMLEKINTNWVQDNLTDDERTELIELAIANAQPDNDLGEVQAQIDALWEAVHALQAAEETSEETEVDEFPEWVKPESKDQYYSYGDKCTYKGIRYIYVGAKASAYDPITYPYAVNADGTVRGWQNYEAYLAARAE